MSYEEYYYQVWNWMQESLISDEYYEKNKELFDAITYDLYQEYNISGAPNPYIGNLSIRIVFSNLQNIGIR